METSSGKWFILYIQYKLKYKEQPWELSKNLFIFCRMVSLEIVNRICNKKIRSELLTIFKSHFCYGGHGMKCNDSKRWYIYMHHSDDSYTKPSSHSIVLVVKHPPKHPSFLFLCWTYTLCWICLAFYIFTWTLRTEILYKWYMHMVPPLNIKRQPLERL